MSTKERTREDEMIDYVRSKVLLLQTQYARPDEQPTSWASATMATLRRADPAMPGDDPALWEVVFDHLPSALTNPGSDEPSRYEAAAHAALCLYAVHQQSRSEAMHKKDERFGEAVRSLGRSRAREGEQLSAGVIRRFHVAGTANTAARRLAEVRALLTMMRSATPGIPLDYGLLARDLLRLSHPATAPGVRLTWGRDLRRALPKSTSATGDGSPETSAPTDPAA